ncbi:MFS transporter [Nocardia sp. alder85J]|uniref:MFS transporter n=1 Tax=Nocardia sp. alder85J TaxID=2862949 RepID=UPI001CD71ADF|nr:MFS transporter [Nocardia sp. alder85J]MCX4091814.1 MFS transporter [Nocardia sp. alder85J]
MLITRDESAPAVSRRDWLGAGVALAAIGWGANQFSPLIVMYQQRLGLSTATVDAMFGLYALGLVPALVAGGRLSDRFGRRPVLVPALALSFVASCLLMAGGVGWLFAGRLLAGIASGAAFGTGAAWVRELSAAAGVAAAGPRRSTVAMTAGFAAGPFVAGIAAQWLPAPTVTAYLPHLVLVAIAVPAALRTPEELRAAPPTATMETLAPQRLTRHFLLVLLPFAPWVFGSAAIALAYLPTLVASRVDRPLLFTAITTGVGAAAGIAAVPLAGALRRLRPGRVLPVAMLPVLAGIAIAAWAASSLAPAAVLFASLFLGFTYGITQFCGLADIQQIADPRSLGTATAVYQMLSYLGFAVPFLLAVAHERLHLTPSALLLMLLAVAVVCTGWLATSRGRERTARG